MNLLAASVDPAKPSQKIFNRRNGCSFPVAGDLLQLSIPILLEQSIVVPPFFAYFDMQIEVYLFADEILDGFSGFGAQFLDGASFFTDEHTLLGFAVDHDFGVDVIQIFPLIVIDDIDRTGVR
jgi:hypothetical protein